MNNSPKLPTKLIRIWGIFAFALFATTWKLWTPQTDLPQIPFFSFLVSIPGWVDWLLLTGLTGCIAGLMFLKLNGTTVRYLAIGFTLFLFSTVLLNQHRLQPWAYLFLIMGSLFASSKTTNAKSSFRWILISIYFYSAFSKLDYQFLHTTGDQMLCALMEWVGVTAENWAPSLRRNLVLALPVGELIIGLLLLIPKTRRFGIYAAITMHVSLIVILGPFGLNHKWPVLIWNLFFVFLVPVTMQVDETQPDTVHSQRESIATILLWFFLLFPATQWAQIADHWVAWEVYAPRSSRTINIRPIETPAGIVFPSLSEWSLQKLNVPIYPQGRFQFAVMQTLNGSDWSQPFDLASESNRWDGTRSTVSIGAEFQADPIAKGYWLNCQPRELWSPNSN